MGYVDWQFWMQFGSILVPSMIAGWWLRGVWEQEIREEREIERARRRHPSTREEW